MGRAERVVSLLPSSTEIVCALGAGERLIGRSHECDFPPEVRTAPVLTRPRIDPEQPSGRIDRAIRTLVAKGLSIYDVDAERLRSLAPDVILTQTLCRACAVTPADLERAVHEWVGARPEIISLEPTRLADVWGDVVRVGGALDIAPRAARLAASLAARVEQLAARARALPSRPRVVCIEWLDPLMAAGNWMPELVDLAGGENLLGEAGEHSDWIELDALQRADPDLILVVPCGFSLARTRREFGALEAQPGFRELRAVRAGRVVLLDGSQYFNRPGPRLVESLEILIEALHPGELEFGHAGVAWQAL